MIYKILLLNILFLSCIGIVSANLYTYDQSGKIIGVTFPDGKELGYQYDSAGNLIEIDGVAQIEEPTTPTVPTNPVTPTDPVTEPPVEKEKGSPFSFDILFFLLLLLIVKTFFRRKYKSLENISLRD